MIVTAVRGLTGDRGVCMGMCLKASGVPQMESRCGENTLKRVVCEAAISVQSAHKTTKLVPIYVRLKYVSLLHRLLPPLDDDL